MLDIIDFANYADDSTPYVIGDDVKLTLLKLPQIICIVGLLVIK